MRSAETAQRKRPVQPSVSDQICNPMRCDLVAGNQFGNHTWLRRGDL